MSISGGHDVVFIDGSDKLPPRIKKGLPSYHTKQAKPPIYKEYFNMINILYFALNGEFNSLNNRLPLVAGMMDNRVLSKKYSDTPNRYPLAFFMPKFCLFSQNSKKHGINTPSPLHRAITTFLLAFTAICYGRVTLKNKPARRIFKAVTVLTESEPYHPLQVVISLTQNNTGGYRA